MRAEKSLTLLELIVVTIIIGILATLAVTYYTPIRERALDKEATANLRLIQAAEKIYRMEYTFYYPYNGTANTSNINAFLKLALPTGANRNWNYEIPTALIGDATAGRNVAGGRIWSLNIGDENAICTGYGCPP